MWNSIVWISPRMQALGNGSDIYRHTLTVHSSQASLRKPLLVVEGASYHEIMDWKPVKGHLLPTPIEALEALLDYTKIFLRLQVEWLAYFGIVKGDDDDSSEPPQDAPADE
jgi:hypothetical protein